MSHDEFTKLYKYIQNEFTATRNDFTSQILDLKRDVGCYSNLVDAYAKRSEIYHEEMLVLNHRVDRSEQWMHIIADKVNVKLIV